MAHVNHDFKSMRELGLYLGKAYRVPTANQSSERRDFCAMQYSEALECATRGGFWAKGAEKLQKVKLPALAITKQINEAILQSAPVGFAPNVGAYCAGLPDSMFALENSATPRPVCHIEVNATLSSEATEAQTYNRGRALLAVIKGLEANGISVSVTAYVYSIDRDKANSMRLSVPVKRSNEALNASKLAFALCNAAFVRRLYCRAIECNDDVYKMSQDAYGYLGDKRGEGADIHFSGIDARTPTHTPEKAIDYVLEQTINFIKNSQKAAK